MRWIALFALPTLLLATLPQDHLSKDEYEDIVRMIFKYIYAHEDICGGILNDEKWMPAGTDCFIPCEYTSNICLLKAHDRSDPHQYCKQLPSRCVAGIRREVGTSYLVPTQAPVDPALYYYGRAAHKTLKTTTTTLPPEEPEEPIRPIEKEIYQMITTHSEDRPQRDPYYTPERSLKVIERDNQLLFDPSSNTLFGPPRVPQQIRVPPSAPPVHNPYEVLSTDEETNPYLEQYFHGRKGYSAEADENRVPLPVSPASPKMDIRTSGGLPATANRKQTEDRHTILYERGNGEVIASVPAFDQKTPQMPIFLGDDKAVANTDSSSSGHHHKLVELSEAQILGGFKHSSSRRVDLFASCCQWAVAGMCDSHWKKVRHVCGRSCGSIVCEESNNIRACSRVLDVDITECYDSLPKLIGLRRPESSHEQPEFQQIHKDTTKQQIESTSIYLSDTFKTRHTSSRREEKSRSTSTTTTRVPKETHSEKQ